MDPEQVAQEEQYAIPYHYLPVSSGGGFRQHEYWSWGFRYLGRLRVALGLLDRVDFESLIDIGCGDGRFLSEVKTRFAGKRLLGIDHSEKAIAFAHRMSPGVRYEQRDILLASPEDQFDVVTLLEVVEHIPDESLALFMAAAADVLKPGGHMIITAPHVNVGIPAKHYRHFDSRSLGNILPAGMTVLESIPFDYSDWLLRLVVRFMGGTGRYYIVTCPAVTRFMFRHYLRRCLYGHGEKRCRRIACIARKEGS